MFNIELMLHLNLSITGIEPRVSSVGCARSTHYATTTALNKKSNKLLFCLGN